MEELFDFEPFAWIKDGIVKTGNSVSRFIPPVFESYCKILHPLYRDARITDETKTGDESDLSQADAIEVRLTYKEMAIKYGLDYTPAFSFYSLKKAFPGSWNDFPPAYLLHPDEGTLEKHYCDLFIDVLSKYSSGQNCYFEFNVMATEKWTGNLLFRGKLTEFDVLYNNKRVWCTPTYWWPEDRSWCICTDYDLTFTLVGGAKEMIEEMSVSKDMEVMTVQSSTRIFDS